MKKYFAELEALGHKTIQALRTHDAGAASMMAELEADVRAGFLTQKGLANHRQAMADKRTKILKDHQEAVTNLQEEYRKAVDKHCTLSTGRLHTDDAEILRLFDLSPAEFEAMAEKYADNPTMGRLLEQYRVQHEGQPYGPKIIGQMLDSGSESKQWHTDWRYQDAAERKKIFEVACGTVDSIIGQKDRFVQNRELNLSRRISDAYHSLQGADPNALPAPEIPTEQSPAHPIIF